MRSALLVALVVHSGCSFVGITTPPSRPTPTIECTDSRALPLVDTAGGVLVGTLAGALMYGLHITDDNRVEDGAHAKAAVVGIAFSLPWLLSATYGFVQTRRCRRLIQSRSSNGGVVTARPHQVTVATGVRDSLR